ncbi:unnamed protein product [Caenorhabditis brenneri]
MPSPITSTTPTPSLHFETWRLFHPIYLCCYCIPVTIHYYLVLLIIKKARTNNGFFLIFYLMGVSDVVYCCSMLSSELAHYTQWFPRVFFVICVVTSYYGVFFNHLANILLSMNRFCATCVWYNTYFDSGSIKKYFVGITMASLVCTLPGGLLMFVFMIKDWGMEEQYTKTGIFSFNTHRTIIITLTIGDTIIGILASLATVYRLKKYKFNYDKSLLLITILHIFPNILVSFFNLDMMFQFSGNSKVSNELSRIFLIFLVSFNSLTIVCTNRKIRRDYLQMLVFWKELDSARVAGKKSSTPRITVF